MYTRYTLALPVIQAEDPEVARDINRQDRSGFSAGVVGEAHGRDVVTLRAEPEDLLDTGLASRGRTRELCDLREDLVGELGCIDVLFTRRVGGHENGYLAEVAARGKEARLPVDSQAPGAGSNVLMEEPKACDVRINLED